MIKSKYWGIGACLFLLLGALFWWSTSNAKGEEDPLNKYDAYLFSDGSVLYWFDLTIRNGKVEGFYYEQEIREEIGQEPYMEENKYPLIGEKIEEAYELAIYNDASTKLKVEIANSSLLVKEQGNDDLKVYQPVDEKELAKYIKSQQQHLQIAIDQAEEKEQNRLTNFFSDLVSFYGYLYTAENGKLQLFIRIDEALREGELSGTLLMMEADGQKNNIYKETKYEVNGITDGLMVEFFTTVDGKDMKLEGKFHESAKGFDLTFWTTDKKISFQAVTEEDFKKSYEQFKKRMDNNE